MEVDVGGTMRPVSTRVGQFSLWCLLLATPAEAQDRGTGLIFTPLERLAGIPLASTPYSGAELPAQVDLAEDLPPPGDQGQQNSCVGWTIAYALKTYHERVEERLPIVDWRGGTDSTRVFSPSFIYNQVNQGLDGGAKFEDALNLLHDQGAAPLSEMPYIESDFVLQPSTSAREVARRYRIDYWRQVNVRDVREVKAQLAAGYPVIVGITLDEGFKRMGPGETWRATSGATGRGHTVLLVGYDDSRKAFKLINSWSQGWGDRGYGWLDYEHFGVVVREGFVAKDAVNGPSPEPIPAPVPGPVVTGPDPVDAIEFDVTDVRHGVDFPPYLHAMRLRGNLTVPPRVYGEIHIVVYLRFNDGFGGPGEPVRSLDLRYATVSGWAATGTPPHLVTGEGWRTAWEVFLPYDALDLPHGLRQTPTGWVGNTITTFLVAEPELFLDNFGVRTLPVIPFRVHL
jgi:Papain family cysteine protease